MSRQRRTAAELLGYNPLADEGRPRSRVVPSRADRGRDLAIAGGAHEGADLRAREMALWIPSLRSADADILAERGTANARARDMLRNDAYIQGADTAHRDSIVGATYMLNAKPNWRGLGMTEDKVWLREFQAEVEAKFTLFAESPDRWIDASRNNTFTELVRLVVGINLAAGESVSTAEWIRDRKRPFSTSIQMIENERLSNPNNSVSSGRLRDGILRDKYGAAQTYYIRASHPSDVPNNLENGWTWISYPARMDWGRQRVIHIREQVRIDQTRGISMLTAGLKEMKMARRFREIHLQNAIVNATFAASIEAEWPKQAYDALGGGDDEDLIEFAGNYLDAVGEYSGGAKSLTIDGVRIPHLYPGQKLQLRPAGQGGPLGTEFEQSTMRYLAASVGVSYEEFSRDLGNVNYSALKAGLGWTHRFMQVRKKLVADNFATTVYRLWFEEAIQKDVLETCKGIQNGAVGKLPAFYDGSNKDAYTACGWLGQGRGQVDELKETQAAIHRIGNNLSTLEAECSRLGLDWREVLAQRAEEKELIEALGLQTLEEQAMINASTGANNSDDGDNPDGDGDKKKPAKKAAKGKT